MVFLKQKGRIQLDFKKCIVRNKHFPQSLKHAVQYLSSKNNDNSNNNANQQIKCTKRRDLNLFFDPKFWSSSWNQLSKPWNLEWNALRQILPKSQIFEIVINNNKNNVSCSKYFVLFFYKRWNAFTRL